MALADQLLADGFIRGRQSVGYGRISDDAEDQLSSLRNQIDFFGYFFDESGFTPATDCGIYHKSNGKKEPLLSIYADEGISGTSLRRREAFKQMIADALKGLFDVIVVKSIQRWARDVENGYPILKDLAEAGVAVYFLDNRLCSTNPTDDTKILNGLTNAQEESTSKSRNVQFSLRLLQKKAKWTGKAMLGYKNVNGYLEPIMFEQCVVMDIAYLFYQESFGASRIREYLQGAGIMTKQGSTKWTNTAILDVISNPIYTGVQAQHMTQMVDVNRGRKTKVSPENWIVTYRPELAIFTFDHWNLMQLERQRRFPRKQYLQIFEENGKPIIKVFKGKGKDTGNGRHSNKHLLSNLIKCGNCGSAHYRRKRQTKQPSYAWGCGQFALIGKKACRPNRINEDDLIEYVKQEVKQFRAAKDDRQWNLDAYMKIKFKPVDPARLVELDQEYRTLEDRFNDTLDQLSDNKRLKDVLERRLDRLQEDMERIQEERRALLNREQDIQKAKVRFNEFMHFLDSLDTDNLTNATLRHVIDRINITTNEVKLKRGEYAIDINIVWKFLDETEDNIFWKYLDVEAEEWKTNVWYKDWTPEEIAEEEARIALQKEFEQTPEGQQYLAEQDELMREIMESERLKTKNTR